MSEVPSEEHAIPTDEASPEARRNWVTDLAAAGAVEAVVEILHDRAPDAGDGETPAPETPAADPPPE